MGKENKSSARKSDSTNAGTPNKVSGIEKVGGNGKQGGIHFPVPSHPEKCDVKGPKGSMDG